MDIRNWPIDKIMQLPDCCFGRRWEIIIGHRFIAPAVEYRISDMALPDVCVLWELQIWHHELTAAAAVIQIYSSIALGDHLPATMAEVALMEQLMPGCLEVVAGVNVIRGTLHIVNIRKPIAAQGRRVVAAMTSVMAGLFDASIVLVFSSIPKEVPDWLISGQGRGL
ncbi:hypothetical protein ES705_25223 [subsurface metagenome]